MIVHEGISRKEVGIGDGSILHACGVSTVMMREGLWVLRKLLSGRSWAHRLTKRKQNLKQWKRFWSSYRHYNRLAPLDRQALLEHLHPCIEDDTGMTVIEPTYFYQDWWAFSRIVKNAPKFHVDVGSHHKFVALLSTVIQVTMVDIRPLSLPLRGLQFRRGSILDLPFENESLESLSSLCVVEHIGLGRYGDALDPEGSEKAIQELKRVVTRGGSLYVSFPLDDTSRVYFNAHRAFSHEDAENMVDQFDVLERKYIYGNQFLDEPRTGFGTGLFHLRKPILK